MSRCSRGRGRGRGESCFGASSSPSPSRVPAFDTFGSPPPSHPPRNPMANLTLYSVSAFIVLDSDGNRVLAKYYPGLPKPDGTRAPSHPAALRDQRTLEKGLWSKTKKPQCASRDP